MVPALKSDQQRPISSSLLRPEVQVEDVAETEEQPDATVAEKRVEEAHDILHRIAAILAMEEGRDEGEGDETGTGDAGQNDDALREEIWNGKLEGETIELKEDEEE